MIRSRSSLGSLVTEAVNMDENANDASAHAEVPEGRQPRLKFRPVKTAGIAPFSAQIHMAMGGDRRWRQIEGADPTRQHQGQRVVLLGGVANVGTVGIRA